MRALHGIQGNLRMTIGVNAQRKLIDAHLKSALAEVKTGHTAGPFDTAAELIASVQHQLKRDYDDPRGRQCVRYARAFSFLSRWRAERISFATSPNAESTRSSMRARLRSSMRISEGCPAKG